MKNLVKLLIILGLSIMTVNSQAWNTRYFEIYPGQSKKIDVANSNGLISLKVKIQKQDAFSEPQAFVTREDSGFECHLDRIILLTSAFDSVTKKWNQEFEIRIIWSPGADLSSCQLDVRLPENQSSQVTLGMSY